MVRELQENMKHNNIHIIGTPEGEEGKKGIGKLFEKVTMEKVPKVMREKVTQMQGTQTISINRKPKRPTSRHIIINMAKFHDKDRILKATREKQEVTYKGDR